MKMRNDAVSRKAVLEICQKEIWNGADGYRPISAKGIANCVNSLPSVDAVPIAWMYQYITECKTENELFGGITAAVIYGMLREWEDGNEVV